VQRVAGFPAIDRDGWLRELARSLDSIEDPGERAKMRALLEAHGWREEPAPRPPRVPLWRRALGRLRRIAVPAAPPDPLFPTEAEAVEYLRTHERPLVMHNPMLDVVAAVPR
jgi:hypothetical protein